MPPPPRPPPPGARLAALRLPRREPFDGAALLRFLAARAVPGVEEVDGRYLPAHACAPARRRRSLELTPRAGHVECRLGLDDLRDLAAAVARCRALFDLDADPEAVDAVLARDPLLGPLVRDAPGRRVLGTVDGAELAVRTVSASRFR